MTWTKSVWKGNQTNVVDWRLKLQNSVTGLTFAAFLAPVYHKIDGTPTPPLCFDGSCPSGLL